MSKQCPVSIQKNILVSVCEMMGLSESTITSLHNSVDLAFQNQGIRGVALLIKSWSKATRYILADEPKTRDQLQSDFGFCRIMLNLQYEILKDHLLSLDEFNEAVAHQGLRPIPPFMLDPVLVRCLLPNPDFSTLSKLVVFSNLGRTTARPHRDDLIKSLGTFCDHVESTHDYGFDLRRSAESVFRNLPKVQMHKASWSLSSHSSLGYPRSKGGKTQEVIDNVIDNFYGTAVRDIITTRPIGVLKDIFGRPVISPEQWDSDGFVYDSFYITEDIDNPSNHADSRLGDLGLLWAMMRIHEQVGYENVTPFPALGYEEFEMDVGDFAFPCRISLQPEEGWKSRILTIADISLAIVGQVYRSIVDPVMRADKTTEIGLTDKVKLYSVLRFMNGSHQRTVDPSIQSFVAPISESVDLQTATDTPPRRVVRTFLRAFHAKRSNAFVRFALSLGLSKREFTHSAEFIGERVPVDHNSAIFMGEGCSGTFLNAMSMWVRGIAHDFRLRFPGLDGLDWDSNQIDAFIRQNFEEIQDFLNTHEVLRNNESSQSGDDVIIFTHHDLSVYLKVLYQMIGMIPSSSTWFSSSQYGTFTEEACIRTHDSSGWKFVDVVKPRLFNCEMGEAMEESIISHIRQVTTTVGYLTDGRSQKSIVQSVDRMIRDVPRLRNAIEKQHISTVLPVFLGGISHPEIYDMCADDLSDIDCGILLGLRNQSLRDQLYRSYIKETDPEGLEGLLQDFIAEIADLPLRNLAEADSLLHLVDVTLIPTPGTQRYKDREVALRKILADSGFRLLSDVLPELMARFRITIMLRGDPQNKPLKPIRAIANRYNRCRRDFPHVPGTVYDKFELFSYLKNLTWSLRQMMSTRAISQEKVSLLTDGHHLVLTSLRHLR